MQIVTKVKQSLSSAAAAVAVSYDSVGMKQHEVTFIMYVSDKLRPLRT